MTVPTPAEKEINAVPTPLRPPTGKKTRKRDDSQGSHARPELPIYGKLKSRMKDPPRILCLILKTPLFRKPLIL